MCDGSSSSGSRMRVKVVTSIVEVVVVAKGVS